MSFNSKKEKPKAKVNMDITSDFESHKVSILEKASRISAMMDYIALGNQLVSSKDDSNKLENIENEQNSCNIKTPQKTNSSPKHNTIFTSNGINFSLKKILLESENQRKEEVRKKMECRINQMKENGRVIQEQMAKTRSLMARERERRNEKNLADILAEIERITEQEEIKRRHEQQLQAQRAQEQKEKLEREVEEYRKQMKEKEELIKMVMAHREQFTTKYCDIVTLSKNCKDKRAFDVILTANSARLKELVQQIEALDEKIKSGELIPTDVNVIENLVHHIDDVLTIFRTEIEKINVQYEAELARKAEAASQVQPIVEFVQSENISTGDAVPSQYPGQSNALENNESKDQSLITNQEATVTTVNAQVIPSVSAPRSEETAEDFEEGNLFKYIDKESWQIYMKSQKFLNFYKKNCKDFLQSTATKKFRFECQKAINIPVNAISGVSEQHLRDKYDRLHNLLIGKSSLNVKQHPQGVIFCKDHLAKKIVSQGETLVSSKPEMAFPVAMIVVALWNEHVDFGELFLARLHETCPFTIPFLLPQQEGQSDEDYYKSVGYKYSEDGTVEKQDKFLKRMSGVMRLYASITVTRQPKGVTKAHPYGLQHAWRWLAAVLNIEPRADICDLTATLILDMLEVAGNILWTAYPTQFHKLLMFLSEEHYPRMRNVASDNSGGPLMRLEEFLNNALASGFIRPAEGMLPPHFL